MFNKMSTRFLTITTLLFFVMAGVVHAQQDTKSNAGSFYSSIGFGVPADVSSSIAFGTGLTGVSTYSGLSANISNPAQWGLAAYTQGSLQIGFSSFDAEDGISTAERSLFGFENFQLVLPILRNKLGVSLSFTPMFRSDFLRSETGQFDPLPNLSGDLEDYAVRTVGSGGVNRFEIGAGYRVSDNLSLGYAFSSHLLAIKNNSVPLFTNLQLRSIAYDIDIEGYSFGHRFGAFAFIEEPFSSEDELSIGLSVSLPVTIDAVRDYTAFRTVNNQREQVDFGENSPLRNGSVKVPLEINTGLTYNLNRFSNIVAELQLQNWENAEYTFSPSQQAYFKDRVKAGLGYQFHPYRADRRSGFFSNFKYSIGGSYDSGHLSIRGEDIQTLMLNAGIGLISRESASSVDLGFHFGVRGTQSSDLVKETIWGFRLSLNLAEFMFVQQRFQ